MTDRELLELAAKAAGIVHEGWCSDTDLRCGLFVPMGHRTDALRPLWNPLANDGDAFRLMARLNINVSFHENMNGALVIAEHHGINFYGPHEDEVTRRAIVRAAAEIGKVMP